MVANLNLEWKEQHVQIMAKYMWNETRILDKTCRNRIFQVCGYSIDSSTSRHFPHSINILLIH